MKPLSEWTTEDLMADILSAHADAEDMIQELLRRKREQCAAACDALAADLEERERRGDMPDGDWSMEIRGYKRAARHIRGMQ